MSLDPLLSGGRPAGACVCVCVLVVSICVWKSLGIFYDLMRVLWRGKSPRSIAKSGTLKHWDFKCVCDNLNVVWGNVKVRPDPETRLFIWTDLCILKKGKYKLVSDIWTPVLLITSFRFFRGCQSDRIDHNVICQFHCVVNWLLHLATELWLNFKVISINTILAKNNGYIMCQTLLGRQEET